jgi:hypothetical protein|tara:strand:+ start:1391 stop:2008 length:618 start_codon:yes stop_codon:yes gene_type:complete
MNKGAESRLAVEGYLERLLELGLMTCSVESAMSKLDLETGNMSPAQEFNWCSQRLSKLCDENTWGDHFGPGRAREIMMANFLGHKVALKTSGADAYENGDEPVEYKSTMQNNISATYNGISVQETWEKQVEYLNNEKICKYKNHYYARFNGGKIVGMYKMGCDKVIEYLLPRLKRQFDKEKKGKDPRLGVTITKKYIINNSEKLL